jgi:hypothetical protein
MAAPCEALKFNVTVFALTLLAGVIGFADQAAATPAGKPLTEKLMSPANGPPVVAVNPSVAEPPWSTVTACAAAVRVSVDGSVSASMPQPFTSNVPSTDPSPAARLYTAPVAVNPATPGTLLFPDGVA